MNQDASRCSILFSHFAVIVISLIFLSNGFVHAQDHEVNQTAANLNFEKALISFEEQDYRTTMIHLKNTFQDQRKHLAGRILYAKILLAHNNGLAAEIELNYANDLGADLNLIRPLQAKALLYQQKFTEALEVTLPGKRNISLETELAYLRGQAFIGLNKFVFAEESFDYVLRLNAKHNLAFLGKAQVFLARKQYKLAAQFTDKALLGYNIPERARIIRAKLFLNEGNTDAALEQLNKAITVNADYLAARMLKAEVLLSQGDIELAEADINYILDRAPKEPQTNYLKVVAATKKGQTEETDQILSKILETLSALPEGVRRENPQYLYLAGFILYKQNNLVEAANFFNQYLDGVNDYRAIVMLGEIELAQRKFRSARNLLLKANRNFPNNETILNLLAASFAGGEQYEDAQRYYIESLQINPNNPSVVLQLARSYIAQEKYSKAISLLLKIEQAFPHMMPALLALNLSFNGLDDFKKAIERSQKLIEITPENALFQFLHGQNLKENRQFNEAKNAYGRAITLAPDYVVAKIAINDLLVINGETTQAKENLASLLEQYPKNLHILQSLALLHQSLEEYSDSILWLEKILAEDIVNVDALIVLEQVYRKTGQLNKAQIKLEHALEKQPIAKLHQLLGGVYLTQRKFLPAIEQYQSYVEVAKNRGYALLVLANAQITTKDISGAISSLKKSLVWDDNAVSTHILLTKLLMANGQLEHASEQIKFIRVKDNSSAIADLLAGDLQFKQQHFRKALSFYQKALKVTPSTASILALYRTYKKLHKHDKAEQLLIAQIDRSKQLNIKFVIALADIYQLQQQNTEAVNLYQKALKSYPNSPVILNNLANNLIEEGETKKANELALRALSVSPNNATILDTLAWSQIQLNQYDVALTNLRKALAIDAENNSIKYHLAIALDGLNRRKAAQSYLIEVVESNLPFEHKTQAKKLLDTWLASS